MSYQGLVTADCCIRSYEYDAELTYSIDDSFSDPFDSTNSFEKDFEIGVPYPLVASWDEMVSGKGRF